MKKRTKTEFPYPNVKVGKKKPTPDSPVYIPWPLTKAARYMKYSRNPVHFSLIDRAVRAQQAAAGYDDLDPSELLLGPTNDEIRTAGDKEYYDF